MEFGDSNIVLNGAFMIIRTTQLDPAATALNKLPGKRTQVANLKDQTSYSLTSTKEGDS